MNATEIDKRFHSARLANYVSIRSHSHSPFIVCKCECV